MANNPAATPGNQMTKFQRFMLNSKRIFTISTKPTRKQYTSMLKICSIGLLIIGGIAFIIQLIATIISGNSA